MHPTKVRKLHAFLAALPDRIARQLATAVEYDRLDGGVMPHDVILEGLRPALRRTGLKRQGVPTLQRAFFEAVEDLLTDETRTEKCPGRLARSALVPIWRWLETDLLPVEVARSTKAFAVALHNGDDAGRRRAVEALWSEAGQVIALALRSLRPGSADYDRQVAKFGAAPILEDARELGYLLLAAPSLRALQNGVPRGTKRLSAEEMSLVRDVYDGMLEQHADQAAYVPVIVMRRLSRPANVMEVLKTLGRTDNDAKLAETTMGMAGDLLLGDLEDLADYLGHVKLGEANANEALEKLERFAEMSAGLTQSLDIRREGRWGKRLVTARNRAAEAMERRVEQIPDEIVHAFPVHQVGSYAGRGVLRPNIGRWPEDAKIERAANLALFLGGARWHAGKALFGVAHRAALDRVSKFLSGYAEDLIAEIKAGDPDSQARCQAHLQALLRIMGLAMGESDADLVRRRAAVAGGAGTAAA